MAYYKTNCPEALGTYNKFLSDLAELRAEWGAFAEKMGGEAVSRRSMVGISLAGLRFTPAKPDDLWTKRDRETGCQRPRGKVPKALSEQRKALEAEWAAAWPRDTIRLDPIFEALGTDWGATFFSGLAHFQHDGYLYAETGAKLGPHMVEILGSEYMLAKEAVSAADKAAKAVPA